MSTKSHVLALLIQRTPAYVSGEEMAQDLAISRTAIWKAIHELKKEGHTITSLPNKGYRYIETDFLSVEGIRSYLTSELNNHLNIRVLESSESTMKDAKLALLNGEKTTLIVANMQEASKGRFGRPFFAKAGAGIYMSLLLHPTHSFKEIAQYTIISAVAVLRGIEKLTKQTIEIKWVNDLYINGKKFCGILSEAISDMESGQISSVVIGIGINFSIKQIDIPIDLEEKATSLFPDNEPTITRNQLIAEIWNQFFQLVDQLPDDSYLEEYRNKSFVLGKQVQFTQQGNTYHGIAQEINNHGELVVVLDDGQQMTLRSGEISLSSIYY